METGPGDRPVTLPDNAYRELAPGETYEPVIPASSRTAEITPRSIVLGLLMTVIFSAAAAYVALKLGQGIETAIPIAILAVGISTLLARKSTLLENVNIIVLGSTAGIVVGGSAFTMPAIYVLGLEHLSSFAQIFIVPLLGALLGVFFLIPFRRYFVAEMHGKLPFPEATATTEIVITGARGGKQALVLLYALGLGMVLDYVALSFRAWRDVFTTSLVPGLARLTENVKAVFDLSTSAAVMGLGYIVGVRYASIMCAGSFLSYFVFIPLFAKLGTLAPDGVLFAGTPSLTGMAYDEIFRDYVRLIGIGAIFSAGFLSILQMSPVIVQAFRKVLAEMARLRQPGETTAVARTEQDIPLGRVVLMGSALTVAIWLYFRFVVLAGMPNANGISVAALALTLVISFLFAAVSAWAVALISITPVSGMTLTTLIIAAVVLAQLGVSGPQGRLAVLLIGGVVCSALSMTGSMVTMLKLGYWLGATPRRIQYSLMGGSVLASVTVTLVILLFAKVDGYVVSPAHPAPVAAPQANAMAAVIGSLMSSEAASRPPWFLYGLGAVIAVVVQMMGISSLAFGLGMYLPMELNTPLLAGAIVAWLVQRSSGDAALDRARSNRGTLIASGLIAGGALAGVLDALVTFFEQQSSVSLSLDVAEALGLEAATHNWLGLAVFLGLGAFIYLDARRATADEDTGQRISM